MKRWLYGLAAAVLGLVTNQAPVSAHPHVWIDLRSSLVVDSAGRVTAVEQEWLFDDFYSMYVYQAAQGTVRDIAKALRELAGQNLKNLEEYRYFTDLRAGGERVAFAEVTDYDSEVRGNRIWMRFVVPLVQPVNPRTERMQFAVYDPTYYIEVVYAKGAEVGLGALAGQGCTADVREPTPSEDAVNLAASLDRDETAGDTLGELFAEWVDIRCP